MKALRIVYLDAFSSPFEAFIYVTSTFTILKIINSFLD
jgi:hypothetical protein